MLTNKMGGGFQIFHLVNFSTQPDKHDEQTPPFKVPFPKTCYKIFRYFTA